jgi:hypothetical protein
MKEENITKRKSKSFTVHIVNLYKHLCDKKKNMYMYSVYTLHSKLYTLC